ncbi:MAG TPA: rod-binding protein [Pirellulales bacterium]|jgi:hypothetical protein|nr:rod-binding protein [Pirellulales bacterium]
MLSPISALDTLTTSATSPTPAASLTGGGAKPEDVKKAFDQFVGETFYSQMTQSLHKMTGKPAYFNGGRAEEVFQGQLDQTLSQKMAAANPGQFSGSMFNLFNLQRR